MNALASILVHKHSSLIASSGHTVSFGSMRGPTLAYWSTLIAWVPHTLLDVLVHWFLCWCHFLTSQVRKPILTTGVGLLIRAKGSASLTTVEHN